MIVKCWCGVVLRLGLGLFVFVSFARATPAQDAGAQQSQSMRFAVAHDHKFSWCYGYLYIDADTISYEVDHPSESKKHGFKINRSELQSYGRWRALGMQMDAIELKFGKSTYHLWWLKDEGEVQNGPARRTEPLASEPADTIIAAIKDPASALAAAQQNNASTPQPAAQEQPPAQQAQLAGATPGASTNPAVGGHLGISISNLTPAQKQSLGTDGVLVKQLEPDGPAAQAGLRVNDVITAINGNAISKVADVHSIASQLTPGSAAQLQILRGGQPMTVKVFVALSTSPAMASGQSGTSANTSAQSTAGFGSARGSSAASSSSAPPDTPPPTNRLSGVYAGMHMGYGPGASAVAGIRILAFFPDGTGMYLPEVGLDGYNLARAIRAGLDALQYGTYNYRNNRVDFRSQDGTANGFDIDPSGSVPGLDSYVRTCHCNGAHFNGTYYWGNKALTITFLPDGRFIDRGAMHDAFQYSYPQNPHAVDPGMGTYHIVDYTIHLNYADGRHLKQSFVVPAHPPKTPSTMWIKGATFVPVPGTSIDSSSAEN